MAINKNHLRGIIRETLRYLQPEILYSEAAVELLMLTAAQETLLGQFLEQLGGGPARGIYQVEPASERHVLETLRARHFEIYKKLMALRAHDAGQGEETDRDVVFNLAYATGLARAYYWLKPGPIPARPGDQADYYKQHWNTPAGKATAAEALSNYYALCLPAGKGG